MPASSQHQPGPPAVPAGDHVRTVHGDAVADPYEWLRDGEDPRVLEHLRAENAYAEQVTSHLGPLREQIVSEIGERTQQTDLSVPARYRGWWYFTRTRTGAQYAISARVPDDGTGRPQIGDEPAPGEQVLIDGNAEAAGGEYFALGGSSVSTAGDRIAFSADRTGDERFDITVRDIATGQVSDTAVRGAGYGLAWSHDDEYLFYLRVDDSWRPWQLWRHRVGTGQGEDVLVLQEDDERFWLSIGESSDEKYLVISAAAKDASEVHLLDLGSPDGVPRCVCPRRAGLEYDVDSAGDVLFITHNRDRADFEVAWAPAGAPGQENWTSWYRPQDGERVLGVTPFARDVVISLRSGGFSQLRLVSRPGRCPGEPAPAGQENWPAGAWRGEPWQVPAREPAHTLGLDVNLEYDCQAVLLSYESLITPPTVIELDLSTRVQRVLRQLPVLGGYDPAGYVSHSLTATAADGTPVGISLVARRDVLADGTAAGVLYAYGAYEVALDPWFSISRLSLLDRGVVWALAHARGGGEAGRSWYDGGRLGNKPNTFGDVAACADELIASGWVAPGRLALEGGSAGGLTVGATLNLDPGRFAVALAQVPFVDPLTTMLDPSMPLTVTERDEWGDPLHDEAAYRLIKSYSPYENIAPVPYPPILATTSLNDTRVSFAEPARWVARLRAVTGPGADRPILLRTELAAGHGGRSGRYDAWEQFAWEESFVLWQLGATERLGPPQA